MPCFGFEMKTMLITEMDLVAVEQCLHKDFSASHIAQPADSLEVHEEKICYIFLSVFSECLPFHITLLANLSLFSRIPQLLSDHVSHFNVFLYDF